MDRPLAPAGRRLEIAELLSIGTELTTGETRDTNAGELARSLTEAGLEIGRLTALPDRLEVVQGAFRAALERADLVVSTGGLGPTPDDLTREAIAAVCGETPVVDAALETWLRGLWARRGIPFPAINLKQAWLIPSARAIANPNGTAPGWWVDRPDGRVIVALPGPPREMRPMWHDEVLPDLRRRGLGTDRVVRTLRLTGIGESVVADRLGETLLRRANPEVATYARADAVDVRMSAVGRAQTAQAIRPERRRSSSTRSSRSSWPPSASTSGRAARRPGPRRWTASSSGWDGRWPCARSGPAARSGRCSGRDRGSAGSSRCRCRRAGPARSIRPGRRPRSGRPPGPISVSP